jgi:magnesium-transporting ATPase (P-type)
MVVDGEEKPLDIKKINKQNEELAKDGFRVIALAKSRKIKKVPIKEEILDEDIPKLSFIGLVAFIDPIRLEAVDAVKACKNAGIKVVMITGDHPLTAFAIARNLGLVDNEKEVTNGEELDKYIEDEQALDKFVKSKKVFTRVTPLQKLAIINSYKRQGEFVAVTGDGVNDAPAIKSANIGVAMGSGTDVAKETASMIIADDDFTSIVNGIKEGRIAYSNIRKITLFLISCGVAEILFFLSSIIAGYEIPLVAIQLLWLNVVTDGLQDISLSFERNSKEIMNEKPRSTKESLFDRDMFIEVCVYALAITITVMALWFFLHDIGADLIYARSCVVMLMVFIQNVHVLNCKSERQSIFKTKIFDNPLIIFTIILSIGLEIVVTQIPVLAKILKVTPLKTSEVLSLFTLSLLVILVSELFKGVRNRIKYNKENNM